MSDEIMLSRLETVPLRLAWKHEAHGLTPWLAANLDRLGDALGLALELEGTELRVESFAADILARDAASGEVVLIENQLEVSDHTHLGQIMTYLAGLEAHVIVWVAPEFREPHRSAIRWLNEHTEEPFAFFAVQLKVVRIADSPLAPVFEVVERPNNWDRRLRESARDAEVLSEVAQRRRAFWASCFERHPEMNPSGAPAPATSSIWTAVPGHPLVVSQYVAKDGVGLFVRSPRGVAPESARAILEPVEAELEQRLGRPVGDPAGRYFFVGHLPNDMAQTANWAAAADWLSSETGRYVEALVGVLGAATTGPLGRSGGEADAFGG